MTFAAPALLAVLLSAQAQAPAGLGFDLGMRVGVASPALEQVSSGPSVGLHGGLQLGPRYRLDLSIERSIHGLAGSRTIDATTGTLGFEVAIDEVPIVPWISIGPALQYAARRDSQVSVWVPTAFLGLGARTVFFHSLQLGVEARYQGADFSAEGFPAFASYFLEIGWAP
jgi:hypothetical protein